MFITGLFITIAVAAIAATPVITALAVAVIARTNNVVVVEYEPNRKTSVDIVGQI